MTTTLISIATYKRPALLSNLLQSLERADLPAGTRVCVVDNDPNASARSTVEATSLDAEYVCEPTPGIAAARNRGLDQIRDDDAIVFVDDDEWVQPDWLRALLGAQSRFGADVVSGPVISVFPPETPRWVVRGGFIQRPRFPTGAPSLSPATNNTLLRLAFWREAGAPRFDETFSLTGGSDTAFFRGLGEFGARMVWTDDAVVYEDVPVDRTSFGWIWRRGVREGNVSGRLHLRRTSPARLALNGLARIVYGAARQGVGFVRGRGLEAKSIAYMTRGVGWIGASTNRLVVEYARAPTTAQDQGS